MTSPHEPDLTADQTASAETTPLPPFVFVPEDDGASNDTRQIPIWEDAPRADQPVAAEAAPTRRWSTGHTIAAAIVAVGVLAAGGVAVAARDSGATGTVAGGQLPAAQGQAPGGQLPGGQTPGGRGAQPGQGLLGGLGQLDVGQLDGLLRKLSSGQLNSDQLRTLLAALGLPDHLDASQLQDLLQHLTGGQLPGSGTTSDGTGGSVHT